MKQSWQSLAAIQLGLIVGLPSVMVGYILASKYGLLGSLIGVFGGCTLLFLGGLVSASLALNQGLTTIQYAELFFGPKGMLICSVSMGVSLFGWFIIQLNLMGEGIIQLLKEMGIHHWSFPFFINIGFGAFITFLVIQGIQTISRFAQWNLPLMVCTLVYAAYAASHSGTTVNSIENITYAGIPLVVASNLAVIVDMPTYYRFARSYRDAVFSLLLTFLVIVPLVSFVGISLGLYGPHLNLISALTQAGGIFWKIWAVLFLVASGCMINNGNIYSCSIAIRPFTQKITQKISNKTQLLLLGALGSSLSCLEMISRFEVILEGIGILLGSMAAVMLTSFMLDRFETKHYSAISQSANSITLLIGAVFGFLSFLTGFLKVTGFAFLDASIVSALGTIVVRIIPYEKFFRRQA